MIVLKSVPPFGYADTKSPLTTNQQTSSGWVLPFAAENKTASERTFVRFQAPNLYCCIKRHDLENLVKNVGLSNQVEPNEPNKLESEELSTKSEPEANTIDETEEVETKQQPNSLEPRV
ncbi:hypothetical protein PVK06_027599 [Gossypium arboreum]|uniref:Uncharacterized protein n=1 Tax=Gossypium arboreum TaxID=29729 RepID=A0ABR0P0T0_GOSAR|nr:hypothetical protein PVK06_027599 [Gossypium arboreum]